MANLKSILYRQLLFEQEGKCFVCGVEEWRLRKRLHLHRIIPNRNGGTYNKENVFLVCYRCHRRCEGMASREEVIANRENVILVGLA